MKAKTFTKDSTTQTTAESVSSADDFSTKDTSFSTLFLTNKDLRMLRVFHYLKSSKDGSTVNISKKCADLSYQTVYQEIRKIHKKAKAEFPKEVSDNAEKRLTTGALKANLVRNSLVYRCLEYIFYAPETPIELLEKVMDASMSTIVRHFHLIRHVLRDFGIYINISDFKITGDERQLRIFFYLMFQLAEEDILVPISQKNVFKKLIGKLPHGALFLDNKKQTDFLKICAIRNKQGFRLQDDNFENYSNIVSKKPISLTKYPEIMWAEYFCTQSPYFATQDHHVKDYAYYSEIIYLTDLIIDQLKLTRSSAYVLELKPYLRLVIEFVQKISLPFLSLNYVESSTNYYVIDHELQQLFAKHGSNFTHLKTNQDAIIKSVIPIIQPYFSTNQQLIFVDISTNYLTKSRLLNTLNMHLPLNYTAIVTKSNSNIKKYFLITDQKVHQTDNNYVWHSNLSFHENVFELSNMLGVNLGHV
ncbi:helix-turn-helix domain-containing protein [Loigolactobacillus iwatensis]|uniref:helix-turn-helix domain-containing protein n=1 Tax=Loigolactobacillus iwatensis TaxID=1267156 RepID=UPI000F7ECFFE|nr:helix-turn-helix domain-containing protein [Loigolactobacillus iwatensis]